MPDGLGSNSRSLRQNVRVSSTSNVLLGKRTNNGKSNLLMKTNSQSPEQQRIQAVNSQNRIHNARMGNIVMYNSKKMGLGRQ